ncbi:hypothetical protein EDD93_3704 [Streptomyces sp. 840.1]|uniref:hypothetical protein n=1 Tax=Streptomyces sp. 840.1 TaxID=2485152 RepID=UPI000F49DFCB|nr:hypothetical protein [Streptomyces sp. 840.1]ROQ69207.1 hypothetical protein EDD93_3704 [Streptomyces sp. 840.1]
MKLLAFLRRRPAPAATATFTPHGVLDGARWLVCETTACAHLTRRHTPAGHGWECTDCHTHKGDQ